MQQYNPPTYSHPNEEKVIYINEPPNNSETLLNEDIHDNNRIDESFDDPHIRRQFSRKVFCLLSLQLLITFGSVLTTKLINNSNLFFHSETGIALYYTCMVGLLVTIIFMSCFSGICRKYPQNYTLFFLFTLFMTYLVSFVTVNYETNVVLLATATTLAISLALSIYAIQTKYDFTSFGAYLIVLLVGLIVASIINIFIQNSVFTKIIGTIGVIIFSCFIVYDVQLIVGGKHRRFSYEVDDYIFATINIYLDIINLFLYILDLFSGSRN